MYNKRKVNKINEKRILHKSHKNWVVVSLALLSALGGGAVVTHANASADTTSNNQNNNTSTKLQQTQQVNSQTLLTLNNKNNSNNQYNLNHNSIDLKNKRIMKHATNLHRNILLNTINNSKIIHTNVGNYNNFNKNNIESLYRQKSTTFSNIIHNINISRQNHFNHNEAMYNKIFGNNNKSMSSASKFKPISSAISHMNTIPSSQASNSASKNKNTSFKPNSTGYNKYSSANNAPTSSSVTPSNSASIESSQSISNSIKPWVIKPNNSTSSSNNQSMNTRPNTSNKPQNVPSTSMSSHTSANIEPSSHTNSNSNMSRPSSTTNSLFDLRTINSKYNTYTAKYNNFGQSLINKDIFTYPALLDTHNLLNYRNKLNNDVNQLNQIHKQVNANYLTADNNKVHEVIDLLNNMHNIETNISKNVVPDMINSVKAKHDIDKDILNISKYQRALNYAMAQPKMKSKTKLAAKIKNNVNNDINTISSLDNNNLPTESDSNQANNALNDVNKQLSDAFQNDGASDSIQLNIDEVKRDLISYINQERANSDEAPVFEDSKYDDLIKNYDSRNHEYGTHHLSINRLMEGTGLFVKDTKSNKNDALEQAAIATHMLKLGYIASHQNIVTMIAYGIDGKTFFRNKISNGFNIDVNGDPDYLGMNTEVNSLHQLTYIPKQSYYRPGTFSDRVMSDLKYDNQSDLDDAVAYLISNNINSTYSGAPDTKKYAVGIDIKPDGAGMIDVSFAIGPDIGEGKLVNAGNNPLQVELEHGFTLSHVQEVMLKNFIKEHHIMSGKLKVCQIDNSKVPKSTETITGRNGKKYTIIPASKIQSELTNGGADTITKGLNDEQKSTVENFAEAISQIAYQHPFTSSGSYSYLKGSIGAYGTVWSKASPYNSTIQQVENMQANEERISRFDELKTKQIQNTLMNYMNSTNLPPTTPTFVIEH